MRCLIWYTMFAEMCISYICWGLDCQLIETYETVVTCNEYRRLVVEPVARITGNVLRIANPLATASVDRTTLKVHNLHSHWLEVCFCTSLRIGFAALHIADGWPVFVEDAPSIFWAQDRCETTAGNFCMLGSRNQQSDILDQNVHFSRVFDTKFAETLHLAITNHHLILLRTASNCYHFLPTSVFPVAQCVGSPGWPGSSERKSSRVP